MTLLADSMMVVVETARLKCCTSFNRQMVSVSSSPSSRDPAAETFTDFREAVRAVVLLRAFW
jgi:hypothetical protein